MNGNSMTFRQGVSICIMYLLASALVLAGGLVQHRDTWLAILMAYGMTLPLVLIYGRLLHLNPDGDYYDLQMDLFGPVFGRLSAILYIWFAFHLGALVIRNFSEFIQLDSLSRQPQYLTAIPMGLLAIWCVISGRMTLARWAAFMLPVFLFIIVAISLLSTQLWQWRNITPLLYDGFQPVFKDALALAAFPFAEGVLLPFVLHPMKENRSATKLLVLSYSVTVVVFMLAAVRNLLVLGSEYIATTYFPSYIAIGLVNIGDFLDRLEVVIAAVFVIGGFVKITVCLYAASLGLSKVLRIGDSSSFAAPLGVLMIVLSQFVYTNILDTIHFAFQYYYYYIVPFSVVIPLALWALCEIRRLRQKKQNTPPPKKQEKAPSTPVAPNPSESKPATEV